MASKKCPQCGGLNWEQAASCDCGYQFPQILGNVTTQPKMQGIPPNAVEVDRLVGVIRFNTDPEQLRAALAKLERLGLVEVL